MKYKNLWVLTGENNIPVPCYSWICGTDQFFRKIKDRNEYLNKDSHILKVRSIITLNSGRKIINYTCIRCGHKYSAYDGKKIKLRE